MNAKSRDKIGFAIALLLLISVACQNTNESPKPRPDTVSMEKKKKVKLPEPPGPEAFEVESKHPDGTLRVKGLIFNPDEYLGQTVTVRGFVSKTIGDCDPGKDKDCPEPHLFLKDDSTATEQLLVIGVPKERLDSFDSDKTYDFEGKYKKSASGFTASKTGLLVVEKINGEPVDER